MRISPSRIPDAGYGVISETFIAAYTWLSEYEGEIVQMDISDGISWYTWSVSIISGIMLVNYRMISLRIT